MAHFGTTTANSWTRQEFGNSSESSSPPLPTPSPAPAQVGNESNNGADGNDGNPGNGMSQLEFDQSQRADQARLPWSWALSKTSKEYTHTATRKWWYFNQEMLESMAPNKRRDMSHIGRIMETELGVQFLGTQRCTACQANGQECWVYSKKGAQQVARPGDTCARCPWTPRAGGCSLSKRKRLTRGQLPTRGPSPSPPLRQILPKGGLPAPPPPASPSLEVAPPSPSAGDVVVVGNLGIKEEPSSPSPDAGDVFIVDDDIKEELSSWP